MPSPPNAPVSSAPGRDAPFRRTLSPEAEFVLLGARTRLEGERRARWTALLESGLAWPRVLGLCAQHRVMGLVGRHLSARGWKDVPPEVARGWQRHFGTMALHASVLASELGRVCALLEDAGVAVVSFKGPTLAQSLYGNGAVRPCADLDLLVPKRQVRRAHALLREQGFHHEAPLSPSQERAHLRLDSVFNLVRPAPPELEELFPQGFAVELHWAITSPCLPFDLGFEAVAPRLDQMALAGQSRPVAALAPEDLCGILAVHGAKHLWERLLWLADVAQLLERTPDFDFDALLRDAQRRQCQRMTALCLSLTRDVMGTELPRFVESWLSKWPAALALGSRLRAGLLWHPSDDDDEQAGDNQSPNLHANRLLARAIDRPGKRMAFFWHIATTPSAHERAQLNSSLSDFDALWWVLGPLHAVQKRLKR